MAAVHGAAEVVRKMRPYRRREEKVGERIYRQVSLVGGFYEEGILWCRFAPAVFKMILFFKLYYASKKI